MHDSEIKYVELKKGNKSKHGQVSIFHYFSEKKLES